MDYFSRMQQRISLLPNENLRILALETSCDETSAAVIADGRTVLSNVIASQADLHRIYGGVVPEIASRKHVEGMIGVVKEALTEAGTPLKELHGIAVTYGPGLVGALLTGVSFAKGLAFGRDVPLIGVHHLEGHICANFIAHPELEPPFTALVASGGHTHLFQVTAYGAYRLLGKTRDDAVGEAYDKIARVMGLGYPGGPAVDALALNGDPDRYTLPKAALKDAPLDFSFSGLKTAVINLLHGLNQRKTSYRPEDICASFQRSVTEVLTEKAILALRSEGSDTLVLAGGVAANGGLRRQLTDAAKKHGFHLYYPPVSLCTDNGAMIGCAGYYRLRSGRLSDLTLNAVPYEPLA